MVWALRFGLCGFRALWFGLHGFRVRGLGFRP